MLRHAPLIRDGMVALNGKDGNGPNQTTLQVDSSDWFHWLETISSFIYLTDDLAGRITVRKERRAHGWYWYAYYRSHGRTRRAYLGKTSNVTQQQLRIVANVLMSGDLLPKTASPPATQLQPRKRSPTSTLLMNKLAIPPLRASLLVLPHSFDLLQRGARYPLTLICAPAGFGKTTLLTQWATVARLPIAWVSLDESDNDPVRFWAYIFSAIERVIPPRRQGRMDLPQPFSSRSLQERLASLINLLTTHPEPMLLVIEDYHALQEENHAIHDGMTFLLEYLPAEMHVVITSRVAPPLPLARLRARGELNELGTADLRITREEASLFLTCMGIAVSEADLDILDTKIAGWITGWQLAALSLQRCQDVSEWIATFNGGHRHIADFLTEEVLRHLSRDILVFLLETAMLARLTAPLCDAVTQANNSQTMLEQLERANLFIEPLDEQRRWYRYHPLFAAALQFHLQQTQAAQVPELLKRASDWCSEQGYFVEAVDYAFKSGDIAFAASTIRTAAPVVMARGEVTTLRSWLDLLPEHIMYCQPYLCILKAHLLLLNSQQDQIERYVQFAEEQIALVATSNLPVIRGEMMALRATIATVTGKTRDSFELHRLALEQLSPHHPLRDYLMLDLGTALFVNGDLAEASEILDALRRRSDEHGNMYFRDMSTTYLVLIHFLQGKLSSALHLHARTQQSALVAMPAESCVMAGLVLYQRNDLTGAEREVQRGIAMKPAKYTLALAYGLLAIIHEAQGDRLAANVYIEQAVAETHGATKRTKMVVRANQIHLWMLQGDLAALNTWANTTTFHQDAPDEEPTSTLQTQYEGIQLARLHLRQGNAKATLAELGAKLAAVTTSGQTLFVLEILLLQALAYDALGNATTAQEIMQSALIIAEPEGYLRIFIDSGAPAQRVLAGMKAQRTSRLTNFVRTILAGFGEPVVNVPAPLPALSQAQPSVPPLIDPLSTREIEILQLLAAGDSNQTLASKLVIAVGTVKRHLSNIFAKLGVQSRTQAVAKASTLHLIDMTTGSMEDSQQFSL